VWTPLKEKKEWQMKNKAEGTLIFTLFTALVFLVIAVVLMASSQTLKAENPALFEADLSANQTSSGADYCSLTDGPFNISVYYNTSGLDQGVTIQRMYRPDGVWRNVKEYTDDIETVEVVAPNSPNYHYRAVYTGTDGGCHVRIDQ